jgi:hypothetical protein
MTEPVWGAVWGRISMRKWLCIQDIVRVSPNGPLIGIEKQKKRLTNIYKVASKHHCTVDQAVSLAKDLLWGRGTWELTLNTDKGPQHVGGYWVGIYRGVWPNTKFILEAWNQKPEPPTGTNQ